MYYTTVHVHGIAVVLECAYSMTLILYVMVCTHMYFLPSPLSLAGPYPWGSYR